MAPTSLKNSEEDKYKTAAEASVPEATETSAARMLELADLMKRAKMPTKAAKAKAKAKAKGKAKAKAKAKAAKAKAKGAMKPKAKPKSAG